MTSEAKIGLLLGLVFIFIIAFIINGLPSFWHKSDNTEMTVATENAENDPAGVAENERKAGESIEKIAPAAANNTGQVAQAQGSEVRSITELPKGSVKPAANTELQPVTVAQALPPQEPEQTAEVKQAPAQPEQKTTYVVSQGDSLYTIAKKFYGAAAAGKKTTTEMLFNANHSVLKSANSLQVGQKLTIPKISDKVVTSSKTEKTENVTTAADTAKPQHAKSTLATETKQAVVATVNKAKTSREYVVQTGDNLWKIAAKQLGNGNRYDEIAELNADLMKHGESVVVGMHLKLPAK